MRVGADAATGSPNALAAGTVKSQLAALLSFINGHIIGATAHSGTAITSTPTNFISSTTIQQQIIDLVGALVSTTSGASGATRVGAEAVSGSPSSLAAGTARSQLIALLSALNGHQNASTEAHAASAISVLDAASMLSAVNAETALAEILSSLSGDHFRNNESYGGQHRTIRQPYLSNGYRSLLWQANGAGYVASEFRVYQDSDSVWFCVAVTWDGSNWVPVSASYNCAAFRIGRNNFEIVYAPSGSGSFATWPKSWNLSLSGSNDSGFMMRAGMKETGRCGLKLCNPTAATASVTGGVVVNYRNRFPSTPSSVTLQAYRYNITDIVVEDSFSEGFALTATVTLGAGGVGVWNGYYNAIA